MQRQCHLSCNVQDIPIAANEVVSCGNVGLNIWLQWQLITYYNIVRVQEIVGKCTLRHIKT